MSLRTVAAAALLLCAASAALAANEKGYVQFPGIGPGMGSPTRPSWLDMAGSDITIELDPGTQCEVSVDAIARNFAPALIGKVGDTLDVVTIELKDFHGQTYYKARLEDAYVKKVVSSTDEGLHIEQVVMEPATVRLDVWKQDPGGQQVSPSVRLVTCGAHR